ncbi:MAG TPA: uroporphyrinogen decarboxylase [Chloroflexota bacterium]|nr:uroporphyrinogen decarboxylase [Chloroflexota bacterium]
MNRLLRACALQPVDRTPVWFMRQAGRVLPEYRAVRQKNDLLAITHQPELCAEVTLQPVRRLGVDAAILFADIMTPLIGIGLDVDIIEHAGPVLSSPIRTAEDVRRLRALEPEQDVPFVIETIRLVRQQLPPEIALIGFAGAPFTLASYLVEGKSSRTFDKTKRLMYTEPDVWGELMSRLADIAAAYLRAQVAAGVQVVQLFDSWVGCLSSDDYCRYVQPYSRRIFEALGDAPSIHFGTDTGWILPDMAQAGGSVIGLDWRAPLDQGWACVGHDRAVQGNLDPAVLLGPWPEVEAAARRVLERAGGRPGHIFNLGHGLHPETPLDNIVRLVELVHNFSLPPGEG